jgi:hypothetical protein
MLSDDKRGFLRFGVNRFITLYGFDEAVRHSPAKHVDGAIHAMIHDGYPQDAKELEDNRVEAERIVAACLGMM